MHMSGTKVHTFDTEVEPSPPRRPAAGRRRARLALAVAPDRLVVARLSRSLAGPRVVEVLECTLGAPWKSGWPELEEALRELAATLGVDGGTVDVALLRRLAHAKVVPLPPVRRAELPALVRRNARRHFAVRDEALVAGGARLPGPRSAALVPTLAACAPAALVQAVAEACAAAGFRVGRIVAGPVALAEAVRSLLSIARRGRVAALTVGDGGIDLVLLEDGAPVRVQPIAAEHDALAAFGRLSAALREAEEDGRAIGCVLVCGSGDPALALRRVIAADETYGARLGAAPEVQDLPAEAVVALGAALAGGGAPLLLPDALVRERQRRARRLTVALGAASAAFVVAAAGLHLWGLGRELEAVRAKRREIAPAVANALEARGNVDGVRTRLAAIAALERGAAAWTLDVAALARALPDSAHLRTFAADSTGLRMAGIARSASAVVPALEASPRFERVSLAAPVRWEQGDAGERFDVAASLERRPAARQPNRSNQPGQPDQQNPSTPQNPSTQPNPSVDADGAQSAGRTDGAGDRSTSPDAVNPLDRRNRSDRPSLPAVAQQTSGGGEGQR